MKKINIGIDENHRKEIVQGLDRLLADSYTLYLQSHNFHWNVTGPMFQSLHLMFEGQYQELAIAIDEIAERIRALGFPTPATFGEFAEFSSIKEVKGVPTSIKMLEILVTNHEAVIRTARNVFTVATEARDAPTEDLLTQRMQVHEKAAWMLRSMLS